uniref:Signal peptide peptidase-like 2B n=2 Tax=Ascaris TaxID=6251 RepID=A0A9J2PHX6_ASCLU
MYSPWFSSCASRLASFLLILTSFQLTFARREPFYDSSYAYLSVRNEKSGVERRICVNYEQWRSGRLPESASKAEEFRLEWWGGKVNNTNVCMKNASSRHVGSAVALNYRLQREDGPCAAPFVATNTSFKGAIQFIVNEMMSEGVGVGLLLVERGRQFVSRWSDYLFSEFYDPDLNQSTTLPTFFIYRHVFFNDVIGLSNAVPLGSDLVMRFYRPPSSVWDASMAIIWFMAVFCVGVGGYWAGHRKTCEERTAALKSPHRVSQMDDPTDAIRRHKSESEEEKMTTPANCIFVLVVMLIVVGILMLGFYFRSVMVYIFNVILAIVGTFSVHRCLTALMGAFCKCGQCTVCLSMNDVTRSIFRRDLFNYDCCSRRPRIASVLLFIFSAALCTFWFFIRRDPYAFLLLDFINVTLCLHVLKGIRFPNLKWLTVLLVCMFIYDMFMVFGTPFLTKNGCSVMIEVAAGTDCAKSSTGYPVAPINSDVPEKFPMLFQVPHLSDPMISCVDLEVEKEFHPVILGLGDVIVPGYLISFCFTVDFAVRTRHIYGAVSVLGYAVGLLATFFALTAMEMAQPALIYLIPFTLLPIVVLALIRKELKLLWNGNFTPSDDIKDQRMESGQESIGVVPEIDATSTSVLPANEETDASNKRDGHF